MAIPKAFVSYSHDSPEHKKWVLQLATRMRNSGIDAILDQWELMPGDDVPHFMESHLATADFVLMICTERYVEKANAGTGGVGYEKMIVTADLMDRIDSRKVIPIIRQEGTRAVPTFLKTKLYIDFSLADSFEGSIDDLVRAVHGAPIYVKPPIAENPFDGSREVISDQPKETNSAVRDLIRIMISDFEAGRNYTLYEDLVRGKMLGVSRVMLDFIIAQATELGYLSRDGQGDLVLEEKGKHFALTEGLVS